MSFLSVALHATAQVSQPLQATNYYSLQLNPWPPMPFNPFPDLPSYLVDSNAVFYDDRTVDYSALWSSDFSLMSADLPSIPGAWGEGGTPLGLTPSLDTNALWIEITGITNSDVFLRLHNTVPGDLYQLLSEPAVAGTTNFDNRPFLPGPITNGAAGTNITDLDPVPMWDFPTHLQPAQFFRAQHADGTNCDGVVSVTTKFHALQPDTNTMDSGQTGVFLFQRTHTVTDGNLEVFYTISGTASNGLDYVTIPASTNFASGADTLEVDVQPFEVAHGGLEQYVTVALIRTNAYLTDPAQNSADVIISEHLSNSLVQLIRDSSVDGITHASGLGFHTISNQVVMAAAPPPPSPITFEFSMIGTNTTVTNGVSSTNLTLAQWSGISKFSLGEGQMDIVQATDGGWRIGDLYAGGDKVGTIDWISANGASNTVGWVSLTNETVPLLSVLLDRTGVFGHDMLAVAGDGVTNGGNVYRIKSNADPTLTNHNVTVLLNLTNTALEGLLVVPADTNKYGPWAGKLLVGAETAQPPAIFAIDTNGVASRWLLNIEAEDFHIIPTNMNFYGAENVNTDPITKLPSSVFSGHVGDILLTQEGHEQAVNDKRATYFILRWDAPSQSFLKWSITFPDFVHNIGLEQGVFAPIDLPAVQVSTDGTLPIPAP